MPEEHNSLFSLNKSRQADTDANENLAKIGHSGNSDVDVHVNVQVDTRPIAYAMLCSLLATQQITHNEFKKALDKLEELTANYGNKSDIRVNGSEEKKGHNQTSIPGLRLWGPLRKER